MNIQQWVNGKLFGSHSIEVCRELAKKMQQKGWQVIELYEIHTLVMFSPNYGEMPAKKAA